MNNIAIIPARGGSKRIPGKNIKEFCGKPIISYSIEAALKSGIFREVMVSTDSAEIAELAKKLGAKVPFMRSEETSNDFAVIADVIHEVIGMYEEAGQKFESACCIYPTAPFVTAEKLRRAYKIFLESSAKTLLPVTAFSFPPQRGVFIRDKRITLSQPEYLNTRSQDIETMYHDCGQFIILKVTDFLRENRLITDNTIPFIMNDIEVQDIDNPEDWEIAELKYRLIQKLAGGKIE